LKANPGSGDLSRFGLTSYERELAREL